VSQHISGRPGQEGEVVLLKKEEEGFTTPPYYARTIKLDPGHKVIWKVFFDNEIDFFGIVEFEVHEANDKTRFEYNLLYEWLVSYSDESELDSFRQQQYDRYEIMISTIFPKLQQLVARGT
jgi:hypothetical protein